MKRILLGLILATFVFGIQFVFSAGAQVNDYLMVDIKYSAKDDSFSILSVDQVATTPEDVALKQSGQYKASIFNSTENRDISSNYFSFAQDSFLDVVLSEDSTYNSPNQENNPKIDQEIILALPFTQSVDMANLVIRIEDTTSGKVLLEKQLADTTFQVRNVNQFSVNTSPPPPVPIPDDLFPRENFFSKYLWYIVAGIGLIVLLGLIVVLLIWRKNKNGQFMPPEVPQTPPPASESPAVPNTESTSSETNSQENKQ